MSVSSNEITQLLTEWHTGDKRALDKLMPLVYRELRKLAKHYMVAERCGHTLQTTALINEAYLRLVGNHGVQWQNRAHFFAIAAKTMRRVLVDHARVRDAAKRGGGSPEASLEEAEREPQERAAELVALDEALKVLSEIDPRKSQVVEMRYFAGLSVDETATALGISPVTVMRDWSTAKAWLLRALTKEKAS